MSPQFSSSSVRICCHVQGVLVVVVLVMSSLSRDHQCLGYDAGGGGGDRGVRSCPDPCRCSGGGGDVVMVVDCSRGQLRRTGGPHNLPPWTVRLDLSHNKLQVIDSSLFLHLNLLTEIKLNHNELETIPDLGPHAANITTLILSNNRISALSAERLSSMQTLQTLDLSYNYIVEVKADSFPPLSLKNLFLNNNRVSSLEPGCFVNLSSSLEVLRLNRNRLSTVPAKTFTLPTLLELDLSRNRVRRVEGLVFSGLQALRSLRMQRNGLTRLMDGAFWGLSNMETLELEHNNLTEVSKGWLYGLLALQHLHLANNGITRIRPDAWECCHKLRELDLSSNRLSRLEENVFSGLGVLDALSVANNGVSFIADGAFRGLANLHTLDLKNNEISWTIEDMNGPFSALDHLHRLYLQGNQIRSVTKKSFSGLDTLEHLDLSHNAIMSIEDNSFSQMKKLEELLLTSSSLLCDCQIQWFPAWLAEQSFRPWVNASCAHPPTLRGRGVFNVSKEQFVCDDFPQPRITVHPETQSALRGSNVTFVCSAASSSDSPMTFSWKKDNEALSDDVEVTNQVHNPAHVRTQTPQGSPQGVPGGRMEAQAGGLTEYTTTLRLRGVDFSSEGRYQCVISNHFGSSYSDKARLTVNVLPSFTKTPVDVSLRAGATARLECAARGHPSPQVAWRKDGGTDFPAARERRFHVMPEDDVFFIVDATAEDAGVYSCTAHNAAGSAAVNATLTVLETPSFLRPLADRVVSRGQTAVLQCIAGGSPPPRLHWTKDHGPLLATERHFFAAANRLLIVVDVAESDAGTYTCMASNALGTERGHVRLTVLSSPNCLDASSSTLGAGGGVGGGAGVGGSLGDPSSSDHPSSSSSPSDGWSTVGMVVIAVVCCVVGTSLVWVLIIYHTRRRSEDCSVANTDETNLPADIPSYVSSQGTLADRSQDGYLHSEETASHHHCMSSSASALYLQPRDMTSGLCQLDSGSESDMEASLDPLISLYQGPLGSPYMYNAERTCTYDSFTGLGCSVDQRSACIDSYSASLTRRRDCYPSCSSGGSLGCGGGSLEEDPFDHGPLMQLPLCEDEWAGTDSGGRSHTGDRGSPSTTFMGTFGKSPRRRPPPPQDFSTGFGIGPGSPPLALHGGGPPGGSLPLPLHVGTTTTLQEKNGCASTSSALDSDSDREDSGVHTADSRTTESDFYPRPCHAGRTERVQHGDEHTTST